MATPLISHMRLMLCASALALTATAGASVAETHFTKSLTEFPGRVQASGAERGQPIYKGGKAVISGKDLIPGQTVTLMRGDKTLNAEPITVDDKGEFSLTIEVDADAQTGLQPVVVIAENPAAADVVQMKISPEVPVSGAEKFEIASEVVTPGMYQVKASEEGPVFVTASIGRPPVKEAKLVKIDPETLKVAAEAVPAAAPAREDGKDAGLFAVYGVDVDNANGNVWVTNTRQNTASVYKQSDLSLVKQFEPGAVPHARDVIVDEANGRAYASATGTPNIEVFDIETLEKLEPITLQSTIRGEEFSTMALDIDEAGGKLVTVSIATPEAAIVDLKTGDAKVIRLPGVKTASGVAYDPQEGLIFVAAQGTDNLVIVKAETGEVLHDVPVGAGALNVAFEPKSRHAFVANRGAGTITVVDPRGNIIANLDAGSMPNQLRADGRGNVWAVNKARGEDDPVGDRIWRITPKE
ncbi:YncE family protein [Paracoccus sp. MBLB3053]|uniref:YncE family protein n=1 Tax=Paracoccus aurantius TaxID=3073814 RepID=A0ABU2HUW5_9RHOB|nr:YncE family protein [Paracoccus sp. MBLB3053]MDS9468839.1 YncE family protein [Paracoccus sp. MBLB3053]